ncbi:MAG: signal peptidase I [Candidatus Moranbacteria bacterium]|nr:signal peptidase I [Candidatus Moranbacteria bacterium]
MAMESEESREVFEGGKQEYLSIKGLFFEMIKVFLLAVVIIIPVRIFLFQPFFVEGSSMEPNFEDGQYLIVSELGYKETDVRFLQGVGFTVETFKTIKRQDVAVFRNPKNTDQFFIKRVIALPEETVAIEKGRIVIYNTEHPSGMVLDESGYLVSGTKTSDMPKITLDEDEYFVLGDNRSHSYDSRAVGPISKDKIIGRVLLRAWPVDQFSIY